MLLGYFNLGEMITNDEIGAVIDGAFQVGGIIYLWYKRWKAGDISVLGVRK